MARPADARIQLCGSFVLSIAGERRERDLPGRQGRLLFAYLVLARMRPSTRSELIEAIWGEQPADSADASLSALLSKLRRVVQVDGTHEHRVALPLGAEVDVEVATNSVHLAESAVAAGDWERAWGPAHVAMYISQRPFLGDEDLPWVEDERRRLEGLKLAAYECIAACGCNLPGTARDTAERVARRLAKEAPFRETGYLRLMELLEAGGNPAEALRVYDELRCRLRDELGTAPGPMLQALHARLLSAKPAAG